MRRTIIVAVLLLAACDHTNGAAAPPASSTSSTTTPTSTTTSTTLDPTTTLSVTDKVGADFTAAYAARVECNVTPEACDYAAIAVGDSEMDTNLRSKMRTRIDGNIRAVPGFGAARMRIDSVDVDDRNAVVITCIYDDVVLFDVQDPADPADDIVINEDAVSAHTRWDLSLTSDGWRIVSGVVLDERFEEDQCTFAA